MTPYITISYRGLSPDASIESAIHRWVARLEAIRVEVHRALVTIEPLGKRRTFVALTLLLANGTVKTSSAVHVNRYVCVGDAFRAVREHLCAEPTATRSRSDPARAAMRLATPVP